MHNKITTLLEGIQKLQGKPYGDWSDEDHDLAPALDALSLEILDEDETWEAPEQVLWLWDGIEQGQFDEIFFPSYCSKAWAEEAFNLLKQYWGKPEAFQFRGIEQFPGPPEDGPAANEGSRLLMKAEFLDDAEDQLLVKQLKLWLEDHIDPEQILKNQRRELAIEKGLQVKIPPFKSVADYGAIEDFIEWVECRKDPSKLLTNVHGKIRRMVEDGKQPHEIQQYINELDGTFNPMGLVRFADSCREELERRQQIHEALEDLLLRGQPPAISIEDYFPAEWVPQFRVLRDGLKFSDEAIVTTVVAAVAGVMSPQCRVKGWSMVEMIVIWLFHIGSSGTAKSVLLKRLVTGPLKPVLDAVQAWNKAEAQRRQEASGEEKGGGQFRPRNLLYTSPTTQGIRADMAEHGTSMPGLLVRDELNGWLKQMADDSGASVGDVEFWLSSYDGGLHSDVFADAKKSRTVEMAKLCVIGGIQPKIFVEQMGGGNANGFNSRPIFVQLPRTRRQLLKEDQHTEKLGDSLGQLYLDAFRSERFNFALGPEAEELFESLHDQMESLSIDAASEEIEATWAKGSGSILRVAGALQQMRVLLGLEEVEERGFLSDKTTLISARTLQLAANLVMAGKNRAVHLHERSQNPMLDQAEKLLEKARKRQGKCPTKGVALSAIRKGWSSVDRPSTAELTQMAGILASQGWVQLIDGGKSIRVLR